MYVQAIDDAITLRLRRTGKTQGQLAEEVGMSVNTFSWKRRGAEGKEFSYTETRELCDVMGVRMDDVLADQCERYGWDFAEAAEGPVTESEVIQMQLADLFGCSTDYLYDRTDERLPRDGVSETAPVDTS